MGVGLSVDRGSDILLAWDPASVVLAFTDGQSIREDVNVSAAVLVANIEPFAAIVLSAPVSNWSIESRIA